MEKKVGNPAIRIFANKIEKRVTFKTKTGHYLELSTLEKTKLLGSNKSKITKDKSGENVTYLEITKVVLVHCNIVNNSHQQDSRVLYTLIPKIFWSITR